MQSILVYSLVSIYSSFYQLYTDAAYTSVLPSFHLLVILWIYTPMQSILVYSL